MRRSLAPALAGALLFLLLAGPSVGQGVVTIRATDTSFADPRFEPANVTAPAGSTLRIQNTGSDRHTFTSVDGAWEEVDLASGVSADLAAPPPGTYRFYCRYHASDRAQPGEGMAGRLVVGPAVATVPAPPPSPPPQAPTPLGLEVALLALAGSALLATRKTAR